MHCEFLERYNQVDHLKSAIIRDMWRMLTQDSSVAETSAEAEVYVRVIQFLLAAHYPELIYDLRAHIGRHKNMAYNQFWDEFQCFLDERSVGNDRHHGEMYMSFAM